MKRLLILSLLPFLFSFSTCGHRGAPLPPLTHKPAPPKISSLIQVYGRPVLVWGKVTTYEDGRKLPAPQRVCYEVFVNFGKRKVKTEKNYFVDKPVKPGEKRCYKVLSVYGKEKSESEVKCLVGKEPIYSVPEVSLTPGDGFVKVEVKNPDYTVEVFRNQKFPFVKPYAVFNGTVFVDRNVKNGEKYVYRFRFAEGQVKGRETKPIIAVPMDNVPPLPPREAFLIRRRNCLIFWEPSPSKDVVGYIVEVGNKKLRTDGVYLFIHGSCSENVKVYAVDKAGNLSKPKTAEVISEKGGSSNGK